MHLTPRWRQRVHIKNCHVESLWRLGGQAYYTSGLRPGVSEPSEFSPQDSAVYYIVLSRSSEEKSNQQYKLSWVITTKTTVDCPYPVGRRTFRNSSLGAEKKFHWWLHTCTLCQPSCYIKTSCYTMTKCSVNFRFSCVHSESHTSVH